MTSSIDVSAKTGLSVEMLHWLACVALQADSSHESVLDASFRLGVRLARGGHAVAWVCSRLGLSLVELRGSRPDDQFMNVVDALARVDDEWLRNRFGAALFGAQYQPIAVYLRGRKVQ